MSMICINNEGYDNLKKLALSSIVGNITNEDFVKNATNILNEEKIRKGNTVEIVVVNDDTQADYIGKKGIVIRVCKKLMPHAPYVVQMNGESFFCSRNELMKVKKVK